ncbi:MAG: NADH-quinone oxidoreductase subunit L [Chthoniobacterales bacterium]|nr:NADH-quinone oxidoreductase subunit L [Chthoniobacterales bacterium]
MNTLIAPWIILFTPLAAAAVILFVGRHSKPLSAGLAIGSAAVGCLLSWWLFLQPDPEEVLRFPWIAIGDSWLQMNLSIPIGVTVDHLSKLMLVVVTTIATLVFTYSIGYMKTEEGYWRYFAGLSLFLFSMLGIVLADNFVMMFIFWELVGLSSYILIGHYFRKDSAADACKQAFIVNRVGDFGFLLGILFLWAATGTLMFGDLTSGKGIALFAANPIYLTVACLLIFCGTVGKSAQMPLHVWLPNSMEGPTPVSSLLHAATMVAAGVYLLARIFPILEAAPHALDVIAWIGGITCFAAALMATQQNDIKRILAYSTISQLGYMVLGMASASSADVSMFHLFTHAFFKCLLFLCAGSVIVGMHHEQDIWKMGALKNKMPVTFLIMCIGGLALSGCPFFSGYYSKDLIIAWAVVKYPLLGWLSVATAGLTAFYTVRLLTVVFLGKPRGDQAKHAVESPLVMLVPLACLALPSFIAGYPFIEKLFFHVEEPTAVPHLLHPVLLFLFAVGVVSAFLLYRNAEKDPIFIPLFANRLYIDNLYDWLVKNIQGRGAAVLSWADRWIVDLFIVQIPSKIVWGSGFVLRFFQIGNIQAYAFFFGLGVIGLVHFLIFR